MLHCCNSAGYCLRERLLVGERWRGQGGEGRDALGARARASKAAGSNRTSRTVMSSFQLSITARMRRKRSPFGNGFAAGLHLKRLASSKSLKTVGSFSNNSPVPHSADFVRMCFRATWRAAVAAPVVVEGGGGGSAAGGEARRWRGQALAQWKCRLLGFISIVQGFGDGGAG